MPYAACLPTYLPARSPARPLAHPLARSPAGLQACPPTIARSPADFQGNWRIKFTRLRMQIAAGGGGARRTFGTQPLPLGYVQPALEE